MRNLLLLFLSLTLLVSCTKNEKIFTIEGQFENLAGDTLYVYKVGSTQSELLDSLVVDEKGYFLVKKEIANIEVITIGKLDPPRLYLIANQGDEIKIGGDWNKVPEEYTISGSKDSELLKEQSDHLYATKRKLKALSEKVNADKNIIQRDSIKQWAAEEYFKIIKEEHDYTIAFIEKNIQSMACYFALSRPVDKVRNAINFVEDIKYYKMVDSSLSLQYPNHPQIKYLNRFIKSSEQRLKSKKIEKTLLSAGDLAPDIKLPSPTGDSIALSSLKGKYVLLDFWASWCSPCRRENPFLVDYYTKYQAKGFEIFQVSLDKTKESWIEAIETDNLKWTHVSDLKHWHSVAAKLYKINSIPSNFLLDKEGKIVAINLRDAALGRKLEEIFDAKEQK